MKVVVDSEAGFRWKDGRGQGSFQSSLPRLGCWASFGSGDESPGYCRWSLRDQRGRADDAMACLFGSGSILQLAGLACGHASAPGSPAATNGGAAFLIPVATGASRAPVDHYAMRPTIRSESAIAGALGAS